MGNMRFKVGDRVRIKTLDWYNENKDEDGIVELSTYVFTPEMSQFCGKVMTIEDVFEDVDDNGVYYMEEIDYDWTDGMIEGLVEEEKVSNVNSITQDRVDKLACKIDEELPSGNPYEWECPEGYQFVDENGNVIDAQKIVLEKKKKEYPKTYEECCKVLGMDSTINHVVGTHFRYRYRIMSFIKLLICRDAYWQIAGEEMGLGKPWEPDWNDGEWKWCMSYSGNYIEFDQYKSKHHTLAFPTEEMRDAFYENFKEEIESVKELL